MPICKINQAEIYYELYGNGQPLVLIGGFGCDHSFWTLLLETLTAHFKVLIFDNRGSGQTLDDGSEFTIETLALDTIALVEALGLEKPHLLGHSMGGAIAQMAAALYPKMINQLMLFNTSAKFNAISIQSLKNLVNLQKLNIDMDLIIDNFLPWGFSNAFLADPQKVALQKKFVKEYPFPQTLAGNARQLEALNTFNTSAILNQIQCLTFIVGTDRDLLVEPQEIEFLNQSIGNSKMLMLPGSHLMLVEKPEISTKLMRDFLKH